MPTTRVHFRAGFAALDLTPDPPAQAVDLSGYVDRVQPALGVRDRLRTAVLAVGAAGEEPLALVGLDLCILGPRAVAALRAACPLPPDRLLLCCSHTHAAPATYPLIGCGTPDPAYEAWLGARVGVALRRALAEMVPCRLGWGRRTLEAAPWSNRRDPAGATDPRLHLLKVERADSARTPICGLWSAACHPVVLGADNRLVSADWVGEVARALPWPSLFLQGFCGDQNPRRRGAEALAAWGPLAGVLGALWDGTPTANAGAWGWRHGVLALPRLPGDAEPAASGTASPGERALARWAGEVATPGLPVAPTPAELTAWRVHNGSAVFWPGEPHCAHAAALPASCLGVGHTGPSVGYVPERAAYERPGYEVGLAHRYYGFPSALAPEAGELLATTSLEWLGAMR